MRILVTGGLGFLGINLCKLLIEQGEEVICVDHFGCCKKENYGVAKKLGIRIIRHDINKPFKIRGNIDQIYHLASRASPINYQKFPLETALTGTIGTKNLLDLAREKKCRILFSSSSEIYGDPLESPQKEDYWGNVNPVGVRSCYDESKRFGETLMMLYHQEYNLDVKIVRIFNSYGPGLRVADGRIISNFINQVLSNKEITIYGDGSQTRSFCYVKDTIDGMYKMMNSENFMGPVNIGSDEEYTIIEVAKIIKKLLNSNAKLIFKKQPTDDPYKRKPDISLAKKRLNWQPKIDFEDGLKITIEYFKNLRRNN